MLQVYCRYDGTRDVDPGHKKSVFGSRPFGVHMDVTQLMAKQVRMERQDTPNISAVSFDRFAAHSFQAYVQSALAFSIKRCGLLYGRVDDTETDAKVVYVDAIYEPEQEGKSETMKFDLTTEQVCSDLRSAPNLWDPAAACGCLNSGALPRSLLFQSCAPLSASSLAVATAAACRPLHSGSACSLFCPCPCPSVPGMHNGTLGLFFVEGSSPFLPFGREIITSVGYQVNNMRQWCAGGQGGRDSRDAGHAAGGHDLQSEHG